jgi:hypothetical protein
MVTPSDVSSIFPVEEFSIVWKGFGPKVFTRMFSMTSQMEEIVDGWTGTQSMLVNGSADPEKESGQRPNLED